jgi:hypothetical protein
MGTYAPQRLGFPAQAGSDLPSSGFRFRARNALAVKTMPSAQNPAL